MVSEQERDDWERGFNDGYKGRPPKDRQEPYFDGWLTGVVEGEQEDYEEEGD